MKFDERESWVHCERENPCLSFSDIIAVAGTGRGADTAAVIKANSSNRFFDIKLREYLVKPLDF